MKGKDDPGVDPNAIRHVKPKKPQPPGKPPLNTNLKGVFPPPLMLGGRIRALEIATDPLDDANRGASTDPTTQLYIRLWLEGDDTEYMASTSAAEPGAFVMTLGMYLRDAFRDGREISMEVADTSISSKKIIWKVRLRGGG